jgi:hypothetical protein
MENISCKKLERLFCWKLVPLMIVPKILAPLKENMIGIKRRNKDK